MRIYPLIFDSMLISKFQVVFSPPIFFRNAEKRTNYCFERDISSPTYKNVVTQFLAGNFYCTIGIYNAKSMFCQNIVPLGQLEAEILIDLCSIKRSYFPDPIKRSYVTEWSVLCTYTTTIFVWVYDTKKYISKHLASVHHKSSTLKGLFLRFYGSDSGDTTFWKSTNSFESAPLKICFFGSPEKLYFLSYDIFICRRRYAVLCPFKYSFGSDLLLLVVSIAHTCFYNKTYNANETIGNVLTDRQMDISFAFVLILTISTHCFGHLMLTVIC